MAVIQALKQFPPAACECARSSCLSHVVLAANAIHNMHCQHALPTQSITCIALKNCLGRTPLRKKNKLMGRNLPTIHLLAALCRLNDAPSTIVLPFSPFTSQKCVSPPLRLANSKQLHGVHPRLCRHQQHARRTWLRGCKQLLLGTFAGAGKM